MTCYCAVIIIRMIVFKNELRPKGRVQSVETFKSNFQPYNKHTYLTYIKLIGA